MEALAQAAVGKTGASPTPSCVSVKTLVLSLADCSGKLREKDGMHDIMRRALAESGLPLDGKVRFQHQPGGDDAIVIAPLRMGYVQLMLFHRTRFISGTVTLANPTTDETLALSEFYTLLRDSFGSKKPHAQVLKSESP